jgi:hypothetical protein
LLAIAEQIIPAGKVIGKAAKDIAEALRDLGKSPYEQLSMGVAGGNPTLANMVDAKVQSSVAKGELPGGTYSTRVHPYTSGPGSEEHKAMRWQEYQDRNGEWSYERWSNVYDQNVSRARVAAAAAEDYRQRIGWPDRDVSIDVQIDGAIVTRRLDIVDLESMRAVEYKKGYITADDEIMWEIERDSALIQNNNWSIEWVFQGEASAPLLDLLENSNIPYRFDYEN